VNQENSLQTNLEYQAEMFSNRLKKRKKHLWKWARRNGISCFRVYSRDIPEVPWVVDMYDNNVHIAEYERPTPHSDEEHSEWQKVMLEAAANALTVPRDRVFFKYREKPDSGSQYEKVDSRTHMITVREGDLSFQVNLSDYIDTGLFLDHRMTREFIRTLSQGRNVLNLYSYTASFSVYAASGGALSTVSVDLSNTYSAWARQNLRLNGFLEPAHTIVTEDVGRFLDQAAKQGRRFDIIVLDPPTFSNSKKTEGVLDIQKDHVTLINSCLDLLTADGIVMFSTNFKKIKFEAERIHSRSIEEITERTIPEDFLGRKPHRAWVIQGSSKRSHHGKR